MKQLREIYYIEEERNTRQNPTEMERESRRARKELWMEQSSEKWEETYLLPQRSKHYCGAFVVHRIINCNQCDRLKPFSNSIHSLRTFRHGRQVVCCSPLQFPFRCEIKRVNVLIRIVDFAPLENHLRPAAYQKAQACGFSIHTIKV